MTDTNTLSLIVQGADYADARKGYARLSSSSMTKLGLSSGDYVKISGKKFAVAKAIRSDVGSSSVSIDGDTRRTAGAGIGDTVTVEKIEPKTATKITIQPVSGEISIDSETLQTAVRRSLAGKAVVKGQLIAYPIRQASADPFDSIFPAWGNFTSYSTAYFAISSISPGDIAVIGESTIVSYKNSVYSGEDASKSGKITSNIHYEDIGGLSRELPLIREMIEYPLRNPEVFEKLGIEPPKGVLLYGPPGTGKTLIARAVANEAGAYFDTISGPEIVSKYYGDSEEKLREIFQKAEENAPSIIFIDEIDSIAPKRDESKGEMERRVVAQLLSLMDGLKSRGKVIVIGATNLPDAIDPALRRGGRFDREIEIGVPDSEGREEILNIHTRNMPIDRKKVDLKKYANRTHGFVGADLALVAKEAAMNALRRFRHDHPNLKLDESMSNKDLDEIHVISDDFDVALKMVQPSAMREVLVEVPDIHWSDVGGLDSVKEELQQAVEWPIKYQDVYKKFATKSPKGFLMFGPPGTGKTLLAKAVANESECNFISVKGPELMSKWVGESEKGVREIFRKARLASPSIIFFDEIDSMVPKRGSYEGSSHVTESIVSQFLTELDGLEELKNVVVIGATNRPDMIDPALLRPGRLEQHIFVPPPDEAGRKQILDVYLKGIKEMLADDIDVDALIAATDGFVGADIEALVREAKMIAIREFVSKVRGLDAKVVDDALKNVRVYKHHFDAALKRVRPSLDKEGRLAAEESSWQYRYTEDERKILEKAMAKVRASQYDSADPSADIVELTRLITEHQKNFDRIKEILKSTES